jgi:hypothetical protein
VFFVGSRLKEIVNKSGRKAAVGLILIKYDAKTLSGMFSL